MLEPNKIYCGDCLLIMQYIDIKSIDMILCDLPYGTTACKWDTIIPFEQLWYQYKGIIKDNGAIVLMASQPFTSALVMSNIKMFKYEWIWEKTKTGGFLNANYRPLKYHENICIFSKFPASPHKNKMKYFPQKIGNEISISKFGSRSEIYSGGKIHNIKTVLKGKYPKSIISFPNELESKHPTQKPVALFEYLIKTYTNEGDLVLDNCIGSGTTAIACKKLDRNFIGIEINPDYVDIANKRLANTYRQMELIK